MEKVKCESCGKEIDKNQKFCEFCGAKNSQKNDLKKESNKSEKHISEKKEEKATFAIVCLIFGIICGLITLVRTFDGASVISLIQTCLFLGAFLLGKQIIKVPMKKLYVILGVVGFALIIPFMAWNSISSSFENRSKKIDLSQIELREYFPVPDNLNGRVTTNRKDLLMVDIPKTSRTEFKDYVNKKVDPKGYNIDLEYEDWDTVYGAFNEEGYSIRIIYSEYSKEMNITLEAPERMDDFEWPTIGLGTKVPKTKSTYGRISWDDSESFIVHVGKTTIADYEEYVKKCEEFGYTIEHSKSKKSYRAKNKEGYELHLMYLGGNNIEVSLKNSEKNTNQSTTNHNDSVDKKSSVQNSNKNNNSTNSSSSGKGIRPEFKKAMDDYEKFIDEYIAFMNKYTNSNGTDTQILSDYAKYVKRYSEMMDSFKKWENKNLNNKELAYYTKVQSRVNEKLADAALN